MIVMDWIYLIYENVLVFDEFCGGFLIIFYWVMLGYWFVIFKVINLKKEVNSFLFGLYKVYFIIVR